jgi:hypothetical protein
MVLVLIMADTSRIDEIMEDSPEVLYHLRKQELYDAEIHPTDLRAHPELHLILPVQINRHEIQRRQDIFGIQDEPPYPYTIGLAVYLGGGIPEELHLAPANVPRSVLEFVFPCQNAMHHPVLLPGTVEAEKFLKVMRFVLPCYSCAFCPTFISEHNHAFGEVCNAGCDICK